MEELRGSLIESLFTNRELYSILFDHAGEAMLFTENSRIIDCNVSACSLFGFESKTTLIGQEIFKLCPEKQAGGFLSSELSQKIHLKEFRWKFMKSDGTLFDSRLRIDSFSHHQSRILKYSISSVQDSLQAKNDWNKNDGFLNSLLETIYQPVFAKDKNLKLNFCNQLFADYVGKTKEEIIGSDVFQIFEKEKAELFHSTDLQLLEKGEISEYVSRFQLKDGTYRDLVFHKNIITGSDGETYGIIGIIEEQTDLETKKKERNESEKKYRNIFENIQDIVYQCDLNGKIVSISPSVEKYAKYKTSEIIGSTIDSFYFNPEDRNIFIQKIEEKEEVFDYEIVLRSAENEPVWASINAHFIYDAAGERCGIEGSMREISDRKQADEKLKLSVSLLQATLDSTTEGILVVNSSGIVTNFNKKFKTIFGLNDQTIESISDQELISLVIDQVKDPEQFLSRVKYVNNHPKTESTDTILLKNGKILERNSSVQWMDGKAVGRVWSFKDVTIRKRAEHQNQMMSHTLKSINECISITDTDNKLLFINEAFSKTYGYTAKEIIGKNISLVRSPNNKPQDVNQIMDLTKKDGWQGELLNLRKDGSEFPVLLSTTQIKDENEKVIGLVGVAMDISKRKQEEIELKENEERYRFLFEGSPDAILLADIETGIIIEANQKSANLLKRPVSEIIGMHQSEIHPKSIGDRARILFQIEIKNSIQGKEAKPVENLILCADGSIVPVEIVANIIHIKGRKILQGVFRDISERKKAEKIISESEKKYRNLIETMPDGVYRSTPEGKFLEVNPAMVRILGYENKEELLAIDIKTQLYFNPEDRDHLTYQFNKNELDVFPVKRKDGSVAYIEDHGWYIKDKNDQILYHEGISRDVTDRKMADIQLQKFSEELQKLNTAKDKFFSIIAHDLKSPFNSIIGLSEIIKTEARELDVATIEQYAGIINSYSNNTFRLLENLLNWALIQQSRMPFRPEKLLLKKLVSEVIEISIEKANSKMIALINYIPDNLILTADENMLKTILRNLISNALKFTAAKGKIELSAEIRETEIEISVKDTGKGINAEDLPKLFDIGTNFTQRGTENEKGTGLGLVLCKEFVEQHGGRIWVESEPGSGSDFRFTIPVQPLELAEQ